MADRYYVNSRLQAGPVTLAGPEAYHLAAVCRARPGDVICLFNGDGAEYPATVIELAKKYVEVRVTGREAPVRELGFRLELAAALPKSDRADVLIEKLTELGVTRFVPLETSRSVVHPRATKIDRLRRAVIEASKQCGRNVLMQIEERTKWTDYLARDDLPARRFVAHPGGSIWQRNSGDIAIAIGPEGGFTDEEVGAARAAGWQTVGLGPRILRVETAAIALAALAG
jgi:16S rRNA (uracil1498-N3)-methyltransferase